MKYLSLMLASAFILLQLGCGDDRDSSFAGSPDGDAQIICDEMQCASNDVCLLEQAYERSPLRLVSTGVAECRELPSSCANSASWCDCIEDLGMAPTKRTTCITTGSQDGVSRVMTYLKGDGPTF